MIFIMYISALLSLSVLLASTILIIWSLRREGQGIFLAKVIGITVFVLSLLSILGIVYFKAIYWKQGYFESPMVISTMTHKNDMTQMREKMMKRLEEIRKMRKQNLESPAPESSPGGKKGAAKP